MKEIDLGEKDMAVPSTRGKDKKWYPTIDYSDSGVAGVSSFDDQDIGKTITVEAEIKLVGINSDIDVKSKGKKYNYSFEVHKIHMPDDLSRQEDALKDRQKKRSRKKGFE